MPTVSKAARVTTKDDAVWRTCPTCGQLAAMAPGALVCDSCAVKPAGSGVWSR
ncbi:hypothetical protein SAMN05444365_1208 [Micromonospora pattaloongensis]|uniref:Uncharacterized protein n=1 Tax=Micromonospora pattaloongensis TaxID=405436 RepID=A0A1H3T8M4_9ACTN|nr:hypothetical protein [Micromonospora pattaloongensis]SDZ46586.1 hypothetical protein SAMN05444365_1208 [Micromonospora pattaloongensis]